MPKDLVDKALSGLPDGFSFSKESTRRKTRKAHRRESRVNEEVAAVKLDAIINRLDKHLAYWDQFLNWLSTGRR